MVIINSINLFGSNASLELATEERLATTIAEPADAIAATYRAFERWERVYLADIGGERETALERYDRCLETVRSARDKWKRAERAQTALITHMLQHPQDAVVRPEVRAAFERLSARDHVRELQREGRFPERPVPESDSMLEFAEALLPIEDDRRAGPVTDGDEAWGELMRLFRLDQRMIMRLKASLWDFERAVADGRTDVESGRLFEANQHETHRGSGMYPVSEEAARVRTDLTAYMTFMEAYGTFVKKAVRVAGDDLFEETAAFIEDGRDDASRPEAEDNEGPGVPESAGGRAPADD